MELKLPVRPVPMFPLAGAFLYPHQLLPLHVFEPRYRQMVEDSLDGPGRIVLATIRHDQQADGDGGPPPEVLPVAGLGEIVRHEKLPDGRFNIWLLGLVRVRLEEVPSERPYRLVRCRPFAEIPPTPEDADQLAPLLKQATETRVSTPLSLPAATSTGTLADLLLQVLRVPPEVAEEIFAEEHVAERARKALAAHTRFPPPRA